MAKFNEGDKLEVVGNCGAHLRVGAKGTVVRSWFQNDANGDRHEISGYEEKFRLVAPEKPTLEVGKKYKITGPLLTANGFPAFASDSPKPTEVTVVRLPSTGDNAYVAAEIGTRVVHQYLILSSIGEEVGAAKEAYVPKVGDRVVPGKRPNGNNGGSYSRHGQEGTVTVLYLNGEYLSNESITRVKFDDQGASNRGEVFYTDQLSLAKPKALEIVVGQQYKLLPDPKYMGQDNVHFTADVTVVEAIPLHSFDDKNAGFVRVMAVDGGTGRGAKIGQGGIQNVDITSLAEIEAKLLEIKVGESYKLLPQAFTNQGTEADPRLTGYVSESWKAGFPSVKVEYTSSTNSGNIDIVRPNGDGQRVHRSFLAPLDAPATTDAAAASAAVDALNTRIEDLESRVETLRATIATKDQAHRSDIAIISEKFIEKADEKGWCQEYDEFVRDEVNPNITVEMETREKEYEVTFTFTKTISVTAVSEDDAVDQARDSDDYPDTSGWSSNSLSEDDYEVEEA
jgi:hypothetical protein